MAVEIERWLGSTAANHPTNTLMLRALVAVPAIAAVVVAVVAVGFAGAANVAEVVVVAAGEQWAPIGTIVVEVDQRNSRQSQYK